MNISVVIPIYNEAKYIERCLKSLRQQTFKPKEIILVDDGSTDETLEIVHKLQATSYKLIILHQTHKGAGAARNLGAKSATGDILVFVDADMEFSLDFLENLVAPIISGQTKGTFSKDEYVKNWHNPWARAWNYCIGLRSSRAIPENYPPTAPVFRGILKSEFDRVAGYDENRGYDDDWTLSEKLGYQASVAPRAIYFHYNPDSWVEIYHQARWRANRKYKYGLLGKIIASIKVEFLLLSTPLELSTIPGKIAFILGTKIGIWSSIVGNQVAK